MSKPLRIAIAVRADFLNPHHQEIIEGIQEYVAEQSAWRCTIDEHPEDAKHGRESRFDGVIARASPSMQKKMQSAQIPLVNVWYQYAKANQPGVYLDPTRAGQVMAEHLMSRGFRRLCYLGVNNYRQAMAVGQAIQKSANENGCECKIHNFGQGSFGGRRYWYRLKSELLAIIDQLAHPFGVIALTPTVARLMVTLAESRGLRVPVDMAMVCVENARSVVELPPQITCLDSDYTRIGYEAAVMLDRLIQRKKLRTTQVIIPPRGIVTRESTDYFAVEDPLVASTLVYISQRLDQKLTVDGLAYEMAVSTRTLQQRFDKVLGTSVSQEIRRLRLELAKRMLADNELKMSMIAQRSGFTSAAIMGEIFQRELGLTPGAYRKSCTIKSKV